MSGRCTAFSLTNAPTVLREILHPYLVSIHTDGDAEICTYQCTEKTAALLAPYENFFALDADTAFYAGEKGVLTTIEHENIWEIDAAFFSGAQELRDDESRTAEQWTDDEQYAEEWGLPFRLPAQTPEEYQATLDALIRTCDSFSLGGEQPEELSGEKIQFLKSHADFFSFGEDVGIRLYRDGFCTFYTVPSERLAVIDLAFVRSRASLKPLYHPLRISYRTYERDYASCLAKGKLYAPTAMTHAEYLSCLDKLAARCQDMYLVRRGEADVSEVESELIPHLLESRTVEKPFDAEDCTPQYPGIFEGDRFVIEKYPCSPEVVNVLKARGDFFDAGSPVDFVFCRYGKCVLYTIAEERLAVMDLWFLGEAQPGRALSPLMKTAQGTIISEQMAASLMNAAGIASREEFERRI